MDLGFRSQPAQQAQILYPSRPQPPKAPILASSHNVTVAYDPSRRQSITQFSIYPTVANPTTFIYEQSTTSKSDTVSSSDSESTTMTFSPATSFDSTIALKSPGGPELFERRFDAAPRRDSFSLRDRNHPSVPRQDPQFAPSESDADELDRIAQVNAQYNSVSSASYYTSSADTIRGEDVHSSSVPHLLESRGSQGSQARNIPQPTYSNSFVNHSPEELHSSVSVPYTGNGGHAPSFLPHSDVDRRVSQNPPYQQSDSTSSTTTEETQSWDSESTQRPSPTLTRQTGPSVPASAYPQAGYHISRPPGSRDYPSPESSHSRPSDHRQAADNLPTSAQSAPLSRQRSSYAEHRTSVVGSWPETNISPSTYESRNHVEFPPLSDTRRHEEYRRDAHYDHSPIPPSSTESVRVYSQLASESRRQQESAIRQYEEPVARRSTDQGRANSGISHRDSTFLRGRVLSTSYNGAPSNHSPPRPGRSSGDSRRDSRVPPNNVPEGQSSTSRRQDSRSLDLVQASSPTSHSPTTRRSSVMFAAAPSRPELPPLDMQAISGSERSGDRQRARTSSVSYQARPVDMQRQRSSDVPAPDPHHDQNRRPRHPDVVGVRNSAYEPEARSQGRYSARLSMSYPAPSGGQRPSPSQATPTDTRARPPFPEPRVAAPEPHRRLSDGDRPSTDVPVYPRSATPYERASGSSRNAGVVAFPSAYRPPHFHNEHLRRFSDGDQSMPPRLLTSGRNSAPIGRSVRWMDNLVCPSPVIANQRKKGWFNRRG